MSLPSEFPSQNEKLSLTSDPELSGLNAKVSEVVDGEISAEVKPLPEISVKITETADNSQLEVQADLDNRNGPIHKIFFMNAETRRSSFPHIDIPVGRKTRSYSYQGSGSILNVPNLNIEAGLDIKNTGAYYPTEENYVHSESSVSSSTKCQQAEEVDAHYENLITESEEVIENVEEKQQTKDLESDKSKEFDVLKEEVVMEVNASDDENKTNLVPFIKIPVRKKRSLSFQENVPKANASNTTRRRKCESESTALNSTDVEGFEDRMLQLKCKELENFVENFVDGLIQESIETAAKTVSVGSVYEEGFETISRSQSESSVGCPETIEQKIYTNSVSEYADLGGVHSFEDERLEDEALDETDYDILDIESFRNSESIVYSNPNEQVEDHTQVNVDLSSKELNTEHVLSKGKPTEPLLIDTCQQNKETEALSESSASTFTKVLDKHQEDAAIGIHFESSEHVLSDSCQSNEEINASSNNAVFTSVEVSDIHNQSEDNYRQSESSEPASTKVTKVCQQGEDTDEHSESSLTESIEIFAAGQQAEEPNDHSESSLTEFTKVTDVCKQAEGIDAHSENFIMKSTGIIENTEEEQQTGCTLVDLEMEKVQVSDILKEETLTDIIAPKSSIQTELNEPKKEYEDDTKDVSLDGTQADCEESMNNHSAISKSSFENDETCLEVTCEGNRDQLRQSNENLNNAPDLSSETSSEVTCENRKDQSEILLEAPDQTLETTSRTIHEDNKEQHEEFKEDFKSVPGLSSNTISEINCENSKDQNEQFEKYLNNAPDQSSGTTSQVTCKDSSDQNGQCEEGLANVSRPLSDKSSQVICEDKKDQIGENTEGLSSAPVESLETKTIPSDDFSPLPTPKESGDNVKEEEEEKKISWKVGYLHVKLPHKTRSKGLPKAWKKRCVAIQLDEFANDPANPCLVLSVYSGESGAARKHSASFWKSVSCQKAVVYRSSSKTHPYAFTLADDQMVVVHLSADSEALSQEWMAAIRAILWPPSPVVQLEKMLNGSQFEISIIDNPFSCRAGLLGMYGYLIITTKKLILVHPQQGYVIQEWYLNTIDKFHLMPQTRIEDVHKVLAMTTCSDSSTGKGDILIFCKDATGLLQAIASTIHQILTHHSTQEGGNYQKELGEIGEWLEPTSSASNEDYYKVPSKQVRSLLDIPNFIFNKPISPGTSEGNVFKSTLSNVTPNTTQDSGVSSGIAPDSFLDRGVTSFAVGTGNFPGKSSDSELSDASTPPRSPNIQGKREAQVPET